MAVINGIPVLGSGGLLGVFGDGSDGIVDISADTNLSRDMYYFSLIIDAGKTLYTKGFRVFCLTTLTENGIIDNTGGVGGNAAVSSPGSAGAAIATTFFGGSSVGVIGVSTNKPASGGGGAGGGIIGISAYNLVNNGTIRANGGAAGTSWAGVDSIGTGGVGTGNNGVSISNSLGGAGGGGGTAGAYSGGTGGAILSVPTFSVTSLSYPSNISFNLMNFARAMTSTPGAIFAYFGGAGGASGAVDTGGLGTWIAAGGSGGGGGGVVILIYHSITLGTVQVNGGAKSAGVQYNGGSSTDGVNGSVGTIVQLAV